MTVTSDWILALSSTAAAAGTVGTLYASVVTLRRQADNDRRRQASRVNVQLRTVGRSMALEVRNHSDGAIYDVAAAVRYEGRQAQSLDRPEQLAAGAAVSLPLPDLGGVLAMIAQGERSARFEATFRDETGLTWRRDSQGRLHEVQWHLVAHLGPRWTHRLPRPVRRLLVWVGTIDVTEAAAGATEVPTDRP
jgi:hypothetical protein